MRFAVCLLLVVFALLMASAAAADGGFHGGFRCGRGRIVHNGETSHDVSEKCGPADAVTTWTEARTESLWAGGHALERAVLVVFDEWQYNLGRNRLVRYLTFANGRLVRTETGGYGE